MIIDINCAFGIVPAAPSRLFDQASQPRNDSIRFRAIFASVMMMTIELGLIFHGNRSDFCRWHSSFDTVIRSHSFCYVTNRGWTFDQKFFFFSQQPFFVLLRLVLILSSSSSSSSSYVHIYSSYSTVRTRTHTSTRRATIFFVECVFLSLLFSHLPVLWFSPPDLQRTVNNQYWVLITTSNSERCSHYVSSCSSFQAWEAIWKWS